MKIPLKIKVAISEEELEDIRNGVKFDWSYTSEDGRYEVETHIELEDMDDMEG